MSFRWTKAAARDANITDAKRVNADYNNYKGLINGGIDRDNLPDDSFDEQMFEDGAFVKYVRLDGMRASDDVTETQPTDYGVTYDIYNGGWFTEDGIEDTFQEGMLQIEWNCWIRQIDATLLVSNELQYSEFQILVDSNPVAYSGRIYSYITPVHMVTNIPISSGTHKIQIQWRAAAPEDGVSKTLIVFDFDGGALTVINRAR